MDLKDAVIDRAEWPRLREYRRRLPTKAQRPEDKGLAGLSRALEAGRQVIDITRTFEAAGAKQGANGAVLPVLALGRADARQVGLQVRGSLLSFFGDTWRVDVPMAEAATLSWNSVTALIPAVPPLLRPTDLTTHYVLWEAEWDVQRLPSDPALVRPLVGPYYEVTAVWDLTEVERLALQAGTQRDETSFGGVVIGGMSTGTAQTSRPLVRGW